MENVIDLQNYRLAAAARRAFQPWRRRFREPLTHETRWSDLTDATVFSLAQPGDAGAMAFYEMIMGALNLGTADRFFQIDQEARIQVVDRHLFMADQVRFELMYRLGWLRPYPCARTSLIRIVLAFTDAREEARMTRPELTADHPEYLNFARLTHLERETFIRRLLPRALERFQTRVR